MNKKEAIQVAYAVSKAARGCPWCIGDAFRMLNECKLEWGFYVGHIPDGAEVIVGADRTHVAVMEDQDHETH